jgi:hypothetical protein
MDTQINTQSNEPTPDNRRRHRRLNLDQEHPASTATLHIQGLDHACMILNFSPCGVCLLLPEGVAMAVGDVALLRTGQAATGGGPGQVVVKRWSQNSREGMIAGFEFQSGDPQGTEVLLSVLGQGAGARDPLTGLGWLEPES